MFVFGNEPIEEQYVEFGEHTSGTSREEYDKIWEDFKDRVQAGGKVLLGEFYEKIGYTPLDDVTKKLCRLWGWDKKGFRQLYREVVTIEPID